SRSAIVGQWRLSVGSERHALPPLQEPPSFEDRRHRLLDPRAPRRGLLRAGEVIEVSPLPARRQRLECALDPRISTELLLQLLGHGKLGASSRPCRGLPKEYMCIT